MSKKKIAIIGAGISGLGCAYALRQHPDLEITVYEGGDHIGGHSNTVDFSLQTSEGLISHGVDTGFLVFNRRELLTTETLENAITRPAKTGLRSHPNIG